MKLNFHSALLKLFTAIIVTLLAPTITYAQSVDDYKRMAEQGDAEAQYNLGLYYLNEGDSQDYIEAVRWLRKAADRDYADAQVLLGSCYVLGYGVTINYKEALELFRKAAAQDNVGAYSMLGICYYEQQNNKEAVKWLRKAAEQGDATAQYYLGLCYYRGKGVRKDHEEALRWFRMAAEQGYNDAQKRLNDMGEIW